MPEPVEPASNAPFGGARPPRAAPADETPAGVRPSAASSAAPPAFVERRDHPRQTTALNVRHRRIDPKSLDGCEQEYHHGVCRNISQGGMLIEVEGHIPPGQVLEIYASDRGSDKTVYGVVETVRAARAPDHYEIGVRFLRREDL